MEVTKAITRHSRATARYVCRLRCLTSSEINSGTRLTDPSKISSFQSVAEPDPSPAQEDEPEQKSQQPLVLNLMQALNRINDEESSTDNDLDKK